MSIKDIYKALQEWFIKRELRTRIFLLVFSTHLFLLLCLILSSLFQNLFYSKPPKKHIVVTTVKLKSTPPAKATSKAVAISKEEVKEVKEVKEAPKIEKKPKVVDKKPTRKQEIKKSEPPAAPKPKYTSSEVQKALQNLNAIQAPTFNMQFDEDGAEDIADESARLAAYIRSWLKLPEFGKVTVRIKFNIQGKILSLETVDSESDRNQKYIEQNLSLLTLPVAKNNTPRQSERSLVLVLSNE